MVLVEFFAEQFDDKTICLGKLGLGEVRSSRFAE